MANNNFKPFASAGGANVMSQADYEALAALLTGFQSGTASSQQLNKVWRQSSIMAAVLAQFIVDLTGQDAIDDGTTATLLANLKTAVQAQSAAVVGQARNVAMSVTAASANATLTADEIVVGTALGGQKYVLGAFSKTINLATTGAGGMDTGAAPSSGYVALYAIYSPVKAAQHASDPITYPDDGSALLATNATSTVAPNVYGGANMPSGYTASALVSVWGTNASGQLVTGSQNGRVIATGANLVLNSSTQQSSLTPLSISGVVPRNARTVSGILTASSSTTSSLQLIVSGLSGIGQKGLSGTAISQGTSYERVPLMTPQTIYYVATAPTGTPTFLIYVTGYEF
ncbi:hypothetical protein L0Z11_09825 [Burkholderia multivorans]|uniref:hypothetical protein n=1 Tax=Burkholderia multivorans TaxID=87883 RepID=UPI0020185440|nr:hypothetical protein [Burkholderia multivorans]UQN68002.1 hypothetical protein L0Z45_09845 [Burkholderia multivorans]UQN73732.1 hypothetical protein L0Z11_09825 [Burkholderia multivorans]